MFMLSFLTIPREKNYICKYQSEQCYLGQKLEETRDYGYSLLELFLFFFLSNKKFEFLS